MKRIFLAVALLIGIVATLGGIYASNIVAMIRAGKAMGGPSPVTVQVMPVKRGQLADTLSSVGTVAAVEGTMVRAEADGRVVELLFSPGALVEAGEILVKLDTEVETAQLAVAQAAAKLAQLEVERARELHRRAGISQAQLDSAEAAHAQAVASVDNLEAILRQKTIRAPFSGKLGVKRISIGDFLNRGQAVVSLQRLDVVRADFAVAQRDIGFIHTGMAVELRADAWPDRVFPGRVTALDAELDPRTRSLSVQAEFDNEGEMLKPGMFVRMKLLNDEPRDVLLVPQSAILFATFGDTLFVVKPSADGSPATVEQRIVQLGETVGDFVEVVHGVSTGEEVVAAGAFKLRNGSYIVHSDVGVVEPRLDPRPANQ